MSDVLIVGLIVALSPILLAAATAFFTARQQQATWARQDALEAKLVGKLNVVAAKVDGVKAEVVGVKADVVTANGKTLGKLAELTEGRRAEQVPIEERTHDEQGYVDRLEADP